jgi:pantetheine-phosphate adenylyltransferase
MKKAIFPGSFDPFTCGHEDIVRRGLHLFDEIVVAIGNNTSKKRYFSLELMKEKIAWTFREEPRVKVEVFQGLTAYFAKDCGADSILRGLRNTTDFEFENTISQANRELNPGLETVFLITSPSLSAIRSTVIREIHTFGGPIESFLPYSLESR